MGRDYSADAAAETLGGSSSNAALRLKVKIVKINSSKRISFVSTKFSQTYLTENRKAKKRKNKILIGQYIHATEPPKVNIKDQSVCSVFVL